MTFLKNLVLIVGLTIASLAGSAVYAKDLPSYITGVSSLPEREPIKYEISFEARFDNRIVIDSTSKGPSVDDVIAGSGSLWDKGGVKIGRFDANTRVSEWSNDGDRRMLFVNYAFGDSQHSIVILGVGTYAGKLGLLNKQAVNKFSIVGGTGKFIAAGGQCEIVRADNIDYMVTCTAFVPDF